MKGRIPILFGLCLFVVLIEGCQANKNVLNNIPTPTLVDPHHHVVDVNQAWLDPQIVAMFKMVEAPIELNLERENITTNQDGTFRAFTTCGQYCRIFVEELITGKIYELQGLPLEWRPFSGFVWITSDILVFDRWSQPHYGVHYAVNIKERKLILASPFPDRLP
jgi:hypothetical protein